MRSSGAAIFPLVLMGTLAAATFWLDRATRKDVTDNGAHLRHDPDFIAERFEVRRYDDDGRLQHTLVAEKMLHFPDDESTELVFPKLIYHREGGTVATARKAWMDKEGDNVRLEGDVRIVHSGTNGPPTAIATEVLHMVPDDEVAHTEAPVTLSHGKSIIRGTGLNADNKSHLMVLKGPVQGIIYRSEKP